MKLKYFKIIMLVAGVLSLGSCRKFFDINKDPDRLPSSFKLFPQLLTSAQVNLGFEAGSDLYRYPTEFMQQMSGEASQPNQTYEYYRYNVTGSDLNNVWGSIFAATLSDLELVISQSTADGSPHYAGVAKILKAYEYMLIVDTWGDVPYTEAQQLDANTQPAYDDDATIYPKLHQLCIDGIADVGQAASTQSPGTNSVFFSNATFATSRPFWIKLANTIRMRLFLHAAKKDPTIWTGAMTTFINSAPSFMASNADNFQMTWYNVANQRSPISAFEVSRPNYLFADARMVGLMTGKLDPRRPFYFTDFPLGSGTYVGVSATAPPVAPNNNYSRIHTFLRGAVTTPAVGTNSAVYSGAAPGRMISYAEYCFIRAEAALMGAPGVAQTWFSDGITASMTEAGVSGANTTAYLAANGTLIGTTAQKLQQIIEEKYVALFGVSIEPWTDYRRTGYPTLSVPTNAITSVTAVPRYLFYPQSEIDLNPNNPGQKNANLTTMANRPFWDQ